MTDIVQEAEDVRVQRSRALLQHALFELTVEKGFPAVTVRDIAKRARVNRSTFYRHYLDKHDMLNQYIAQLQAQVAEAAARAENAPNAATERVPTGLLLLLQHVQEHAAFYRVMLGEHGDQGFTYRFRQLSEQRYRSLLARFDATRSPSDPPIELQVHYISHAFVGAIQWWLENNVPCSVEQCTLWLSQLSMSSAGITLQQARQPKRTATDSLR